MAQSRSRAKSSLGRMSVAAAVVLLGAVVEAATVTYDFDINYVTANPDGAFERKTVGINGQWPIPRISATVGDTVIVNVKNSMPDQSTSLHFHGLFMNGTAHMDGPSMVTQCPIPPGGSFTYNFTACTWWCCQSAL